MGIRDLLRGTTQLPTSDYEVLFFTRGLLKIPCMTGALSKASRRELIIRLSGISYAALIRAMLTLDLTSGCKGDSFRDCGGTLLYVHCQGKGRTNCISHLRCFDS